MTTPPAYSPADEPGRFSALVVYLLYLLSIPSLAVFALVGVIVALAARDGAGPLARSHLDYQVRIWFTSFWWTIALAVLMVIGWILTIVLIGLPIIWIAGVGFFIIFIWFTVVSLLGLLALLDGRRK
ncbi:MAG: hypothetical protein JNK94_00155 [Hyphomonadaceae bacterium]|nr:hypothetical protein [Hyphomonadaceae bacterium]MBX3510397.1 hypothetical protein [Hyphomonadaceae bacterium]